MTIFQNGYYLSDTLHTFFQKQVYCALILHMRKMSVRESKANCVRLFSTMITACSLMTKDFHHITQLLGMVYSYIQSCPSISHSKESAGNAGDPGSISGWERSPGKGNGYLLQYSCLERSVAVYSPLGLKKFGPDGAINTFTFIVISSLYKRTTNMEGMEGWRKRKE